MSCLLCLTSHPRETSSEGLLGSEHAAPWDDPMRWVTRNRTKAMINDTAIQRVSIRTLRPMVQPNSASACRNAPTHV
jgi:hypothetical protein